MRDGPCRLVDLQTNQLYKGHFPRLTFIPLSLLIQIPALMHITRW